MFCHLRLIFRITSGLSDIHSFDTHFMKFLFVTPLLQLREKVRIKLINASDSNIFLIPFDARRHKSLFAVIGAENIQD